MEPHLSRHELQKTIYRMYRSYYLRWGYLPHLLPGERLKRKILWCLALRGIMFLLCPPVLFSSQYASKLGAEESDAHP